MRNILSMNDFILLESKEGRTKRMLKSKGYDPQKIILTYILYKTKY